MIDISVIIPCYNCAGWIDKCIYALERQTIKCFEVICIDDCSTDDTYDVINKLKDEVTFTLIAKKNEKNIGPAQSRNYGISIANGSLLAFCDSDDWYDETYLEEMYNKLKQEEADLVMCEYRKIYESKNKKTEMHYLNDYNGNREDLLAYSKAAMWLLMYKKELTRDIQVPDLRNGEDIAYVPCIESRAKKIAIVKKVLYNYQMREGSASKTPSKRVYESLIDAYDFVQNNFVDDKPEVIEYIGIKTILYGAILNACKAGESEKIIKNIIIEFEEKYPNWKSNKYMFLFGKSKKIFLEAVRKKKIKMCKLYAKIHQHISV